MGKIAKMLDEEGVECKKHVPLRGQKGAEKFILLQLLILGTHDRRQEAKNLGRDDVISCSHRQTTELLRWASAGSASQRRP